MSRVILTPVRNSQVVDQPSPKDLFSPTTYQVIQDAYKLINWTPGKPKGGELVSWNASVLIKERELAMQKALLITTLLNEKGLTDGQEMYNQIVSIIPEAERARMLSEVSAETKDRYAGALQGSPTSVACTPEVMTRSQVENSMKIRAFLDAQTPSVTTPVTSPVRSQIATPTQSYLNSISNRIAAQTELIAQLQVHLSDAATSISSSAVARAECMSTISQLQSELDAIRLEIVTAESIKDDTRPWYKRWFSSN
jgi:hypothetical protein